METNIALAVGQALSSKLTVLQQIDGKRLNAVWQCKEHGSLDRVILDFGPVSFLVSAVTVDDSIDFRLLPAAEQRTVARANVSQSGFWKEFIGRSFGWGWITVNQQGYCDGLLLSFDGIDPQILMNVVASSLKLRHVAP